MILNWNNIRIHSGSQDQGFEELCSQLFHNEPLIGAVGFERRGYRDAGLECAHILGDGSLLGMQAKFFSRAPTADEWRQIDRSVNDAIEKNPTLKSLTICIPQNFDDSKIPGQASAMDKWKSHRARWQASASAKGRDVEFVLWDDTQLTQRLTHPRSGGKLWYFFRQKELAPEWFLQRVEEVAADARPRYTEELNVRLPIAEYFEGLGRTQTFARHPLSELRKLRHSLVRLSRDRFPQEVGAAVEEVSAFGERLLSLMGERDFADVAPLPLERLSALSDDLREAAHSLRAILSRLEADEIARKRQAWEEAGGQGTRPPDHAYGGARDIAWEIASAAHHLGAFARSDQAELANHPVLLITGGAGKGKTHLLVDVAKIRASRGLPTIVLLGENFRDADPLGQIMELLGLSLDREEFLLALEAAAEASGGRALLMIDAINEGAGLQIWPKRLSGLLKMLARHPRIGVALSVRTTYEDAVVPPAAREATIRVVHEGFAAKPEAAARAFFGHYGINLPKIPLLNPEFTNPLFLKLLCQGLKDEGLRDIPEGYEGVTRVFDFLVVATNNKLVRSQRLKTGPHQNLTRDYLGRLADAIAESDSGGLPLTDAEAISRELYPSEGYLDSLLAVLISEGLLATEMVPSADRATRVHGIAFAYQRFGDHSIARRLLDLHCEAGGVGAAFLPDGAIGRLFEDRYDLYRRKGLLEALSIQLSERYGLELADVLRLDPEQPGADTVVAECLLESLLWRRKESINDATFAALQRLGHAGRIYDRYPEILLTLAAVPDHPLNAERLHHILAGLPLTERDQFWTVWIDENRWQEGAVDRLLAWGLLGDEKSHLSDDSILLACLAISWLTASTVRGVRDRATKALVRLLTPRPHLIPSLLDLFEDVEEPYVAERLYAAAYGVSLRLTDPDRIRPLALDIYVRLFAGGDPLPHVLVRDYGRCVIDQAAALGCDLPFDPAGARPPYGSSLPAEPPTRAYFEGLVNPDGEWSDHDRAVSHVVNRFGQFDVSRYAGGPSLQESGFSSIPLDQLPPPTRRHRRKTWERSLTAEQRALWNDVERLRYANLSRHLMAYLDDPQDTAAEEVDGEDGAAEEAPLGTADTEEDEDPYELACQRFEAALAPEQRQQYEETFLTPMSPAEDSLPALDPDLFVRWVIQGALDLGWTAKRFARYDARVETMRSNGHGEPLRDTVGAKYLWMAYHEVFARVADNFRLIKRFTDDEAPPYDGSWQTHLRTIDPSCLPPPYSQTAAHSQPFADWPSRAYDITAPGEAHEDWLRRTDDIPDLDQLLIVRDHQDVEWIVLEGYPDYTQEKEGLDEHEDAPQRNLWLHLRGYLVARQNGNAVFEWMKSQDFMGRWMPEGGESHDIFLGEFYESAAWRHSAFDDDWQYVEWRTPDRGCPGAVSPVGQDYFQSSDDASTANSVRVMVPSPLIVREAGLKWVGEAGQWLAGDDVAVQDPSPVTKGKSMLLMRRDALDRFLDKRGYELVWTVLGEKLMLTGYRDDFARLEITGAARYSSTGLLKAVRTKYL